MKIGRVGFVVTVASIGAAAFGIACSSSSPAAGGGGGADAGHDSAATGDSGASAADTGSEADTGTAPRDDAGCVTVVNEAPLVQEVQVASAPPTPAGGPMTDGTYFATAAALYTGPGGATGPDGVTVQDMSVVTGGGTMYVLAVGVGAGATTTNGTLTISGASLTITPTCPAADAGASPYDMFDSDGTTVTIYTSAAMIQSITFKKQ